MLLGEKPCGASPRVVSAVSVTLSLYLTTHMCSCNNDPSRLPHLADGLEVVERRPRMKRCGADPDDLELTGAVVGDAVVDGLLARGEH